MRKEDIAKFKKSCEVAKSKRFLNNKEFKIASSLRQYSLFKVYNYYIIKLIYSF